MPPPESRERAEPASVSEERPKIVVGVDASEESKEALRWAARYARCVGARLEVVHAWHLADEYAWLQRLPPPADPTGTAREVLDALVDEIVGPESPVEVETTLRKGQAAGVLAAESKGASLLVVGSRGHGGFDGLMLGSVSAQCVAHAPCSVVVVRPPT